jgi:hypothetical protein
VPAVHLGPHRAVAEQKCTATLDLAGERLLASRGTFVKATQASPRPTIGSVGVLAVPGSVDVPALNLAAQEFGWTARVSHNLDEIATTNAERNTVAVFLLRDVFGPDCSWVAAIRLVRFTLLEVRLVICHGITEAIDWRELADEGAFHGIEFPLRNREVRQSLGFIWEADRNARSAERAPEIGSGVNLPGDDSLIAKCFRRLASGE